MIPFLVIRGRIIQPLFKISIEDPEICLVTRPSTGILLERRNLAKVCLKFFFPIKSDSNLFFKKKLAKFGNHIFKKYGFR